MAAQISQSSFSVQETIPTTTPGSALEIVVFQGRSLAAKDSNGLSDPYLKLFLLDKKGKGPSTFSKKGIKRSRIVKESLNPTFVDAHFEWPAAELTNASALCLQVWGMLFLVKVFYHFSVLLKLTISVWVSQNRLPSSFFLKNFLTGFHRLG